MRLVIMAAFGREYTRPLFADHPLGVAEIIRSVFRQRARRKRRIVPVKIADKIAKAIADVVAELRLKALVRECDGIVFFGQKMRQADVEIDIMRRIGKRDHISIFQINLLAEFGDPADFFAPEPVDFPAGIFAHQRGVIAEIAEPVSPIQRALQAAAVIVIAGEEIAHQFIGVLHGRRSLFFCAQPQNHRGRTAPAHGRPVVLPVITVAFGQKRLDDPLVQGMFHSLAHLRVQTLPEQIENLAQRAARFTGEQIQTGDDFIR